MGEHTSKLPVYGTTLLFYSEGYFLRSWFSLENVQSFPSFPPSPGQCLSVREGSDTWITNGEGWTSLGGTLGPPCWLLLLSGWPGLLLSRQL